MLRSYFLYSSNELTHSIQGLQGNTLNMCIITVGLEPVGIDTPLQSCGVYGFLTKLSVTILPSSWHHSDIFSQNLLLLFIAPSNTSP